MIRVIWDSLREQDQIPAWQDMRMGMGRAAGKELEWHQALNLGKMQPRQHFQLHKDTGTLPSGSCSGRRQCPCFMLLTPYHTVPYSHHWRFLRGVFLIKLDQDVKWYSDTRRESWNSEEACGWISPSFMTLMLSWLQTADSTPYPVEREFCAGHLLCLARARRGVQRDEQVEEC